MWTRFDDDAIWIAVGLRFGANLSDPHVCPCGSFVKSRDTYGLSCKRGSSKLAKCTVINNIIHRALVRARIPSILEPWGLSCSYSKSQYSLTLVLWSAGKSIISNVTDDYTQAASYIHANSKAGSDTAEISVTRKEDKHVALSINYDFIMIALETLGPLGILKQLISLKKLGRYPTIATEDPREMAFLFQC